MKKIFKFHLPVADDSPVVVMPNGAKILDVDHQDGKLWIWAICNPYEPGVEFKFKVHGTGFELPNVHEYEKYHMKTVHVREQGLVWHVFDLNRKFE